MRGKKKILVILGIVAIVMVVGAAVVKSKSSSSESAEGAIYVETASVGVQDLESTITTKGTVQAKESAKVYSEVAGLVSDVLVDVGDVVETDQILVQMDTDELDRKIRDAKLQVDISQLNYTNAQSETSLNAAITSAKTAYDNAEKSYGDAKALFESGAMSQNELDTARQRVDTTYDEYMEAVNEKDERSGSLKVYALNLENAQNAYKDLLDQKEKASIKAPMSGTVTRIDVKKYDMTTVGAELVLIETTGDLEIDTYIGEYDVNKVEPGMSVKITGYGVGDNEYEGKVASVGSSAEVQQAGQTTEKSVLVKVEFNDKTKFKPNFTADLDIVYAVSDGATVIPYEGILNIDKDNFVIKIIDGKTKRIPVEIGVQGDLQLEVISPEIAEGDTIVLNPSVEIEDGVQINEIGAGK